LSQPPGSFTPILCKGPNVKLKVISTKALKEMPLFKIKKGKSFQGTGPAMWYRRMAYPNERIQVKAMIMPEEFLAPFI
jgi:hypothetical protein